MTREEVKVEFTGLAHDHLMASSRMQSARANTLHHHHLSANPQQANHITQGASSAPNSTFGCLNSIQDKTNIIQCQSVDSIKGPTAAAMKQVQAGTKFESKHKATALSTIAILRRHPMYDSLVLVKKFRSCLNGYTLEFPTSYVDDNSGAVAAKADTNTMTTMENQDNCAKREFDFGCGRTKLVSVYLDGDDPIYQNQHGQNQNRNGFQAPEGGDIVYVPTNGLLDRLDNFDRHGISIDSRVYAFAMGLKTAERFLTSSTEKEIQEAPPL